LVSPIFLFPQKNCRPKKTTGSHRGLFLFFCSPFPLGNRARSLVRSVKVFSFGTFCFHLGSPTPHFFFGHCPISFFFLALIPEHFPTRPQKHPQSPGPSGYMGGRVGSVWCPFPNLIPLVLKAPNFVLRYVIFFTFFPGSRFRVRALPEVSFVLSPFVHSCYGIGPVFCGGGARAFPFIFFFFPCVFRFFNKIHPPCCPKAPIRSFFPPGPPLGGQDLFRSPSLIPEIVQALLLFSLTIQKNPTKWFLSKLRGLFWHFFFSHKWRPLLVFPCRRGPEGFGRQDGGLFLPSSNGVASVGNPHASLPCSSFFHPQGHAGAFFPQGFSL